MGLLADCHNHTQCSVDSTEPLENMTAAAAKAGIGLLCTTDHLDLLWRGAKVMEAWDWTPVLTQYEHACATCPKGLELRLGIEVNAPHLFPERAGSILAQAPLDMVIGSMHNESLSRSGLDFVEVTYPDEAACIAVLDDYFESLTALSQLDCVDVLGHIPYLLRYLNVRDGNHVTLDRWRERIRIILKNVAQRGGGIEVNTNRGKDAEQYRTILTDYREAGGEIVTMGSDAHRAQDVGKGIAEAAELIHQCGFDYYAVYRRRRPEFISLKH